jgi:hypothetical protein
VADLPRELIVRSIFRALSARWSERQHVYDETLGPAVETIFGELPATPEAIADEASKRLFETLDLMVASIDFLAAGAEKAHGTPRQETADLLETILLELVADDDSRSS